MNNQPQLELNDIIDEILQKFSAVVKESAMKTAVIKQYEARIKELEAKVEDGK